MTNGDRIRQMSNEELANALGNNCDWCTYEDKICTNRDCKVGILEYIEQEYKETIKNCPCCNGKPERGVTKSSISGNFIYFIRCENCKLVTNEHSSMEDAIQAWNRREG